MHNLRTLDDQLKFKELSSKSSAIKKADPAWCVLEVRGKKFRAALETLQLVPRSKMAYLKSDAPINSDGSLYVDRDPVLFEHVLNYLKSDRKFLPMNITKEVKKAI